MKDGDIHEQPKDVWTLQIQKYAPSSCIHCSCSSLHLQTLTTVFQPLDPCVHIGPKTGSEASTQKCLMANLRTGTLGTSLSDVDDKSVSLALKKSDFRKPLIAWNLLKCGLHDASCICSPVSPLNTAVLPLALHNLQFSKFGNVQITIGSVYDMCLP